MSVASQIYTPEDLLRMPDNNTLELVDGQVVEKNVGTESSDVEGTFYFIFRLFLMTNPVARAYPATLGYQCFDDDPGKIRKPDATVIRLDRLKKLSDPNPGYMPIVPDLAVEVISPNDVWQEVADKIKEYLGAGFPLIWVADPSLKTVTAYPGHGHPAIYRADEEITAEAVLPGFHCKVGDFFPAPIPIEKK